MIPRHIPSPIIAPPICADCQRLHRAVYGKWGLFCDAFPDGIPEEIIASQVDHRQPVDGDHGLQFLPFSAAAAANAARTIDEAQHAHAAPEQEQPNGRQPQ